MFGEPTIAYRLGFALGVQLFVERSDGAVLFQLRGPSIGRDLLLDRVGLGGLMPGEEPRWAVLADAAEELGLAEDALPGFQSVAIVLSDDTGSALVVYHADLREGAEPRPDPARSPSSSGRARPGSSAGRSRWIRSRAGTRSSAGARARAGSGYGLTASCACTCAT